MILTGFGSWPANYVAIGRRQEQESVTAKYPPDLTDESVVICRCSIVSKDTTASTIG